jgi:uncharacterized repeat protein (TIGR01451 family)
MGQLSKLKRITFPSGSLILLGAIAAVFVLSFVPLDQGLFTAKLIVLSLLVLLLLGTLTAKFMRWRAWMLAGLFTLSTLTTFNIDLLFSSPAIAATENFATGAYVIDMGQANQTIANGLKPYGLVYELVVKKAIPVKWAIDSAKAREGIDFSAGGKSYKGGSFIIPSEYAADAAASITAWKAQGVVVDGPLTSGFTAPIYTTITNFPNTVLDFQNGSISQAYFTNAGIPASTTGTFGSFSTYRFGYPSSLNTCDDIFVMPHADPTWTNHQNLIPFVKSKGFIWAACHAVSVLERIDDPGDTDLLPDTNFLSYTPTNIVNDSDGIPTNDSPSLKLFGKHASPTAGPYQYANTSNTLPYGYGGSNLWAYPIMQFLGKIDLATQNGSEQIYIPETNGAQWRNETAIATYDDLNTDSVVVPTKGMTPPTSQIKAAKMVFGPAFGNSGSGMVMYEAGHSHAKATGPDNIAAQRAFLNFVLLAGIVRGMNVSFTPTPLPATVPAAQKITNLQATVTGGSGTYSYKWYSSCGGNFSNPTGATTDFTAPTNISQNTSCALRVVVTDGCNRRAFGSQTTAVTPPLKQADLEVFKTDGQTQVLVDNDPTTTETITYTVSVKNNGPTSIDSFTLNDVAKVTHNGVDDTDAVFPSGLTITPISITTLSTGAVNTANKGSMSGNTWTATSGFSLASDQVLNFTVTGNLNTASAINTTDPNGASDPDLLINTASITVLSGYIDSNSANNSSTDTDEIKGRITDISVTKIDDLLTHNDLTQAFKGQTISYKITVKNEGNVPIAGVQLQDYVYHSNNTSNIGTVWSSNANTPTDNVDTTYPTTNTLAADNTVYGKQDNAIFGADFAIESVSRGTAPTSIKRDGTNINWTGLNLNPSESASLILTSTLNKDNTQTKYAANVIRVEPLNASRQLITDNNTANNTYYDVNQVVAAPAQLIDLKATKTIDKANPQVGDQVTYTITFNNLNTTNVSGAAFQDTLPAGIDLVSWACKVTNMGKVENNNKDATNTSKRWTNCTIGGNSATVPITDTSNPPANATTITGTSFTDVANRRISGTLNLYKVGNASEQTAVQLSITGTVRTDAAGSITNTVQIHPPSGWSDPGLSNNYASASVTLPPTYKMSMTKSDGLSLVNVGDAVTYTITVTNQGPDTATAIKVLDDLAQGYLLNPTYTAGAGTSGTAGTYNGVTGDWTGLNLTPGKTVTLSIAGTVASNAPLGTGTLVNTATLTIPSGIVLQNSSGTVVSALTAQDSDDVNAAADLAITKTDNQTSAKPGQSIGYTLEVTNNGPSTVDSVTVNDAVPTTILNPVFTPLTGTYTPGTGAWTGLNLVAGQSTTLTLQGTLAANTSGNLINTATVAPPMGVTDPNSSNNSSTDTDILIPTADLSISKSDGRSAVNPGDTLTYTIKVTNNGPSAVSHALLTDSVPNDVMGVNWSCTLTSGNGSCDDASGSGNTISTTLNLDPGATVTYTLQGTVQSTAPNPGTLTNTATIALPSGVTDPNLSNNSSTDSDAIPIPTGVVDLAITKTDGQTQVIPGSPVTYNIEVTNHSPTVTVYGVKVTDILPPASQLENVFFSSPDGSYNPANGEWDVTLPPGATALLMVDASVPLTASSGPLTNTAVVYPPDGFTDPDCSGNICSGDNSATDTDTITGSSSSSPNVLLVKRITAINGDPGSNPNDQTPLDQVENLTTGPQAQDDDHPHWPNHYLQGAINGGQVKPDDQVDYKIYFLSAGEKAAAKVKVCDRIPQNQTFVSTTFGAEQGIQVEVGGQTVSYTNRLDGDTATFYPPGESLPSFCGVDGSDPNVNPTGAIVVDLGTLPKSDSPATPPSSYGFIHFRAKVK